MSRGASVDMLGLHYRLKGGVYRPPEIGEYTRFWDTGRNVGATVYAAHSILSPLPTTPIPISAKHYPISAYC